MNASGGDWFESEAFWERFYPFMFAEPQFASGGGECAEDCRSFWG